MNTMTMNEWEETFKPVNNHLDTTNASFQDEDGVGIMFETYGEELDYIDNCNEHHVWTYVDSDLGTEIISGKYLVNRIGYFVTEKAWDTDVTVVVSEDN